MNHFSLLVVLMVQIAMAAGDPMSPKPWQGVWTGESVINNGTPLPDEKTKILRLTLTADRYKTELGDQVLFDSAYTVDSSKSPAHIDIIGTEGEFKGKAALGLIKVDGDTLTMCYVMPGSDRPTAFASAPDSRATLLIMRRRK